MQIRPLTSADLQSLRDIDGTIESLHYLHLDRKGQGLAMSWSLQERPLRTKLIAANPLAEDHLFLLKQITSGIDEGLALLAEHEEQPVGLLLAQPRPEHGTLRIHDVRVDYDYRRQGVGMAMVYQAIQSAREQGLRAVAVQTRTNNFPANEFFSRCDFDLAGMDTQRQSNHDLVKEAVTLFWYAALD